MTSFEKISSTKVGSLPVQLWQSRDTGMRVCLVTAPGPLVHAALVRCLPLRRATHGIAQYSPHACVGTVHRSGDE